MVFFNFSKSFDTVGKTGLWQLLKQYGRPEKFYDRGTTYRNDGEC